jgi:hypothetical protein
MQPSKHASKHATNDDRPAGRRRLADRGAGLLPVTSALLLLACGSGDLKPVTPVPNPGTIPGGKDGGSLPGLDAPSGSSVEVGNVAVDAACVTQSNRAERVPLDLYVMLDASYSMGDLTGDTKPGTMITKWDAIKAAINGFAADPQSAGLGLGLQIFPVVRPEIPEDCFTNATCGAFGPCLLAKACATNPGRRCESAADCGGTACTVLGICTMSNQYCTDAPAWCTTPVGNKCELIPGYCELRDVCDSEPYAKPAVPIAELPGVAAAIKTALDARKPEGRTPTGPALAGALDHARARRRTDRTRQVAVVLGSDGFPSACAPNTISGVVEIARAGGAGMEGVSTFAVGVVSPDDMAAATPNLNALAMAGGTQKPFVINALNSAEDVTRNFLQALQSIRAAALACEFKLPAPQAGGTLDYTKINVQLTAGNGAVTTIGNVENKDACDPVRGGWYYDIPLGQTGQGQARPPSTIITCAATCERLKAEPNGKLDVVLGCRTLVE